MDAFDHEVIFKARENISAYDWTIEHIFPYITIVPSRSRFAQVIAVQSPPPVRNFALNFQTGSFFFVIASAAGRSHRHVNVDDRAFGADNNTAPNHELHTLCSRLRIIDCMIGQAAEPEDGYANSRGSGITADIA